MTSHIMIPEFSAAFLHNFDPFLWQFPANSLWGEHFGIRWYGLAYLAGFVIGYFIVRQMVKKDRASIPVDQLADLATYVAIGTLAGGRLGYCLFYRPDLLTSFRSSFPYWDVLAVQEGGMASHGGIAGIMVAVYIFARRHKLSYLHLQDLTTLGGAIGIFCGRIANFINGELVGRAASPDFPLAVKFPQDMLDWSQVTAQKGIPHLEQLQGITPAVTQVGVLESQWQTWIRLMNQDVLAEQSVRGTLFRLVDAVQNGNTAVQEAIAPYLIARHPSQLYQALLEGLFIFICLFWIWRKPRKPGVISAWFGILYATVRIIGEQFRMPDAHIGFQALGLTRGQWLSIGMLALGFFLLWYWTRGPAPEMGGWGAKPKPLKPKSK